MKQQSRNEMNWVNDCTKAWMNDEMSERLNGLPFSYGSSNKIQEYNIYRPKILLMHKLLFLINKCNKYLYCKRLFSTETVSVWAQPARTLPSWAKHDLWRRSWNNPRVVSAARPLYPKLVFGYSKLKKTIFYFKF